MNFEYGASAVVKSYHCNFFCSVFRNSYSNFLKGLRLQTLKKGLSGFEFSSRPVVLPFTNNGSLTNFFARGEPGRVP